MSDTAMSHSGEAPARGAGAPQAGVPAVRLSGVRRSYGPVTAVAGVDLEIAEGEFFTMVGPSGSGKTTLLRLIAGFERPDAEARDQPQQRGLTRTGRADHRE